MFKNPVRTAKKTQLFTVTNINRLTLFKEIIAVYCENRTEQTQPVGNIGYALQVHVTLQHRGPTSNPSVS
jgi:hypothetical protein